MVSCILHLRCHDRLGCVLYGQLHEVPRRLSVLLTGRRILRNRVHAGLHLQGTHGNRGKEQPKLSGPPHMHGLHDLWCSYYPENYLFVLSHGRACLVRRKYCSSILMRIPISSVMGTSLLNSIDQTYGRSCGVLRR